MSKYRQFIMGLIIGALTMVSVGVFANSSAHQQITAWLVNNVQFIFNGEYKSIPEEYGGVIIYQDRTYVPTRFIAENLDAEVNWDDATRTVQITSQPCPVCPQLPEAKEEELEDENIEETKTLEQEEVTKEDEKKQDTGQPEGNYTKTPVTKYYEDMEVTVSLVNLTNEFGIEHTKDIAPNHTRIHLRVENFDHTPLQVQQTKTKAIVDGKEYTTNKVPTYQLDEKWYRDIRKDDVVQGYIPLPLLPEDAKEMKLFIYILENDWKQTEREIECDIALDLD